MHNESCIQATLHFDTTKIAEHMEHPEESALRPSADSLRDKELLRSTLKTTSPKPAHQTAQQLAPSPCRSHPNRWAKAPLQSGHHSNPGDGKPRVLGQHSCCRTERACAPCGTHRTVPSSYSSLLTLQGIFVFIQYHLISCHTKEMVQQMTVNIISHSCGDLAKK